MASQMTSFVCTVASKSAGNWPICRTTGLWGVPRSAQPHHLLPERGDRLLVWLASVGFIAECHAIGPARIPGGDAEVPWPGGVARYRQLIPMVVKYETAQPVWLTFERGLNQTTGLHLYMLRSGLEDIPDDMAAEDPGGSLAAAQRGRASTEWMEEARRPRAGTAAEFGLLGPADFSLSSLRRHRHREYRLRSHAALAVLTLKRQPHTAGSTATRTPNRYLGSNRPHPGTPPRPGLGRRAQPRRPPSSAAATRTPNYTTPAAAAPPPAA